MGTDMDRRSLLKGVGVAGVAGLAGCTGGPSGGGGNGNGSGNGTGTGNGSGSGGSGGRSQTHVGMVYALGGLGDKSFNDAAQRGVKRAKNRFGISYNEAEPGSQDAFAQYQRRYASSTSPNYDLVACIGYAQTSALKGISNSFPDQQFLLVDGAVDRDNVASYRFKEHQGSFQAGHLAGLLTARSFSAGAGSTNPSTRKVGFVGGENVPLIQKFQAGYEAGANHASEGTEVPASYIGSFNDASSAKATAQSMYGDGVDVIYHAAGAAGVGVFQAATETGNFAIGVDSAQSKTQPNYANVILGSMVKGVDKAVFESVKNVANGNFKGGSTVNLGLKNEGVSLVYGDQLGSEIPSEVKTALDESREKIIDGTISVPEKPR